MGDTKQTTRPLALTAELSVDLTTLASLRNALGLRQRDVANGPMALMRSWFAEFEALTKTDVPQRMFAALLDEADAQGERVPLAVDVTRLGSLRAKLGMTQQELADRVGCQLKHISVAENTVCDRDWLERLLGFYLEHAKGRAGVRVRCNDAEVAKKRRAMRSQLTAAEKRIAALEAQVAELESGHDAA